MSFRSDHFEDGVPADARKPARAYEPPRVEKGRRLAEVTGETVVVPSGAPLPQ